ncbi:MAG: hypothetical protein AB1791_17760 [Chloroflexota bacterium]
MRYLIGLGLGLLLVTGLLTACAAAGSEEGEVCLGDGSLFSDDFSDEEKCGWTLYSQGGTTAAIANGVLTITTSQPGQIWWSNPGRLFDDAVITVQARQAEGPNDNAFGLVCRYQSTENFYVFLISGDGYYAIGKYQSGTDQIEYLTGEGQYLPSDAINQGVATNQIRASCIGNQLSLMVNGLHLATVTDPTFVTGDVGLAASTFQAGTAVIQFDDFRVVRP